MRFTGETWQPSPGAPTRVEDGAGVALVIRALRLAAGPGCWPLVERVFRDACGPGGGIAASWVFALQALNVSTVGLIPQGLPSLTLPDPGMVLVLLPGAIGIALRSGHFIGFKYGQSGETNFEIFETCSRLTHNSPHCLNPSQCWCERMAILHRSGKQKR